MRRQCGAQVLPGRSVPDVSGGLAGCFHPQLCRTPERNRAGSSVPWSALPVNEPMPKTYASSAISVSFSTPRERSIERRYGRFVTRTQTISSPIEHVQRPSKSLGHATCYFLCWEYSYTFALASGEPLACPSVAPVNSYARQSRAERRIPSQAPFSDAEQL